MIIFYYVVFILLGYLSGSLLWSRIIAKIFCGHNIVEENSDKNPGAAMCLKLAEFRLESPLLYAIY